MMVLRLGGFRKVRRLFESEVIRHFGFVRALGYGEPSFTVRYELLLGVVFEATFLSPSRELTIDAIKGTFRLPGMIRRNITNISVLRLPCVNIFDHFMLSVYLPKRRPDVEHKLDAIETLDRSLEDVIRLTLPICAEVMRGELRPILSGESWESGFFYDWTM